MFAPAYIGLKTIFFQCFRFAGQQKLLKGIRPSYFTHVRWCEHGAPVQGKGLRGLQGEFVEEPAP